MIARESTKYQTETLNTSTGIWRLAAYINHSCIPNCERTFIGDMHIVRAAADLVAGTELTWQYQRVQGSLDHEGVCKKLIDHWGFCCDCAICMDYRSTPAALKSMRTKLLAGFKTGGGGIKKQRQLIKELEKTYQRPAREVPRREMWDVHFSLLPVLMKTGEPGRAIEQILATLSSVGFVVNGILPPSKGLQVKKWGLPLPQTTQVWLTLRNAYLALGQAVLAEQAKEYARISYMLLVGEDTSFVYE